MEGRQAAEYLFGTFPEYRKTANIKGSTMLATCILYNKPLLVNHLIRKKHDPNPIYAFLTSAENQSDEQKTEILRNGSIRFLKGKILFFDRSFDV